MDRLEERDRSTLAIWQRARLDRLLRAVLPANPFYRRKLRAAGLTPADLIGPDALTRLPFTTKEELLADQQAQPPYGTNLTYPPERYHRLHQTSGTMTGQPLRWLDDPPSWAGLLDIWDRIFGVVGVRPGDRLFFPFSFGPFLGFWTAFEAAGRAGYLCLPGGGMSSTARARFLLDHAATVVCCTPTYALRLAEAAVAEGLDLKGSAVRALVVAGEPGGSIPATRQRIEEGWGCRVFDHHGLTEVGPVAIECPERPGGLHILETDYVAEVIDPTGDRLVSPGTPGELILTGLVRMGSPLLRYRTGDLVIVDPRPCPCGRTFVRLEGGIRGRTDDMIQVRGNNLYPSALEAVIHHFPEVAEYRVTVDRDGPLAALRIELEPVPTSAGEPLGELIERVGHAVRDQLLFRAEVTAVPPGTLPRFEMKSKRIRRN